MARIEDDDIIGIQPHHTALNSLSVVSVRNMSPKDFKQMSEDRWCTFSMTDNCGYLRKNGCCIGIYILKSGKAWFYSRDHWER